MEPLMGPGSKYFKISTNILLAVETTLKGCPHVYSLLYFRELSDIYVIVPFCLKNNTILKEGK